MTINSLQAAQAYLQSSQVSAAAQRGPDITSSSTVDPGNFSSLVQDAISQTVGTVSNAEAAATNVTTNNANLVDVVTAISAAEVSLEAAIAVRNRMIEAYQEIMRMPI